MNLSHLAACLDKIDSKKPLEMAFSHYLNNVGFRHFAFTYYAGHVKSNRHLRYDYASDALRPWHTYYLEQTYADVDRTLEENHLFTLPLFWDVHTQLAVAKNKREERIRLESIEFGIHQGLSIPVHGPQGDFASLTLHQCQHETCLKDHEAKQFEWLSAAQIYYHYIKKLLDREQPTKTPYHLTKREEQCLTLTAQSFRVEQIAKELGISVRTVNFHIQNANKKLGVNNKYQACQKMLVPIENRLF